MNTAPGAMKDEDIAKYNKAYPPMKPKHGRFSPDGQFFLCESVAEIEKLEALGWNTNPFEHDPPYKPEAAKWREKWEQIDFNAKPAEPAPDVMAELAAARARIAELEASVPKKPGPKPKIAA